MYKFLGCVLIFSVLLLASCGSPETQMSSFEQSGVIENSNIVSIDDASESGGEVIGDISDDSKENSCGAAVTISSVNRNGIAVNLAEAKAYYVSSASHAQYPDNGFKLTDGVFKTSFDRENWVGFAPSETTVIVLDLGKVEHDLADFAIGTLRMLDYGIGSPEVVSYEISTDGNVYHKIGMSYRPADVAGNESFSYKIKLTESVSARYIRYTVKQTDAAWLFLGELYVVRYVSENDAPSYYGNHELPMISSPVCWSEGGDDYDKTINLIAGKTPIVESEEPITKDFATEYYNSIAALSKLTDGSFATKATYSDSAWVHFTRSSERYLYFDLEYTSAVTGVLFSFLQENQSGVCVPGVFSVYLSDDGVGWQCVYTVKPTSEKDCKIYKCNIVFDKTYKARFVKIAFAVGTHVFCDELQIFGTKFIPSTAVTVVPDPEKESEKLGYIMPDDFLGVHNVLLSYHCLPEDGKHSEAGLITVEEYLPHVGYYDQSGKLVDTFFDAYLYLPYTSFNFSDQACTLEGWKFYLDDIFADNRNMDALNQAVEKVKNELKKPDYTCTVFTSILYPWKELYVSKTMNSFGDLDGDGAEDSFASLENRKKAVKWMMDQEYNRFCEADYENLKFGGFYWFEEAIFVGSAEDKELINFASDYAHSLGVKIFWIPYYCASGYDRWQEYGFDLACMQPNYMFGNSDDPSVLESTAKKTSELGMCVEIEMNSLNRVELLRYLEYLAAGEKHGYMNAVKMYYQGGVPGVIYNAYKSTDSLERTVYDLTYLFAKERFTAAIPDYTTSDLTYICSDGLVRGDVIASAEGTFGYALAVSPSGGDLRLNNDGSFEYYAREGFVGTDRFAVVLDFGYGQSEEIVVSIDVV